VCVCHGAAAFTSFVSRAPGSVADDWSRSIGTTARGAGRAQAPALRPLAALVGSAPSARGGGCPVGSGWEVERKATVAPGEDPGPFGGRCGEAVFKAAR